MKMTSKEALSIVNSSYDGDYESVVLAYTKLEKDLDRLEMLDKNCLDFIMFLIGEISNRKLNDNMRRVVNIKTGKDHGTLKEYINTELKELFNVTIEW